MFHRLHRLRVHQAARPPPPIRGLCRRGHRLKLATRRWLPRSPHLLRGSRLRNATQRNATRQRPRDGRSLRGVLFSCVVRVSQDGRDPAAYPVILPPPTGLRNDSPGTRSSETLSVPARMALETEKPSRRSPASLFFRLKTWQTALLPP